MSSREGSDGEVVDPGTSSENSRPHNKSNEFDGEQAFASRHSFGLDGTNDRRTGSRSRSPARPRARDYERRRDYSDQYIYNDRHSYNDRHRYNDRHGYNNQCNYNDRRSYNNRRSYNDRRDYNDRHGYSDRHDNRRSYIDRDRPDIDNRSTLLHQDHDGRNGYQPGRSRDHSPRGRLLDRPAARTDFGVTSQAHQGPRGHGSRRHEFASSQPPAAPKRPEDTVSVDEPQYLDMKVPLTREEEDAQIAANRARRAAIYAKIAANKAAEEKQQAQESSRDRSRSPRHSIGPDNHRHRSRSPAHYSDSPNKLEKHERPSASTASPANKPQSSDIDNRVVSFGGAQGTQPPRTHSDSPAEKPPVEDETSENIFSDSPPAETPQVPAKDGDNDDEDMFDIFSDEFLESGVVDDKPIKGRRAAAHERSDARGYFQAVPGELLGDEDRYLVQSALPSGQGSFSIVVKALDQRTNQRVAIKIMRDQTKNLSLNEDKFLMKLNEADPTGKAHIIQFKGSFAHHRYLCHVFEWVERSLGGVISSSLPKALTLSACRTYAKQLFESLELLKKCEVIHKDIKPDNILVDKDTQTLKLIDFGTAERPDDPWDKDIMAHGTPYYRAPEVFLGIRYGHPYDMWSVGCVIYEMYTGETFQGFHGANPDQILLAIQERVGSVSKKLVKRSMQTGSKLHELFFDNRGWFITRNEKGHEKKIVVPQLPYAKSIRKSIHNAAAKKNDFFENRKAVDLLIDLLSLCLKLDPEKRLTPEQALSHPFLLHQSRP